MGRTRRLNPCAAPLAKELVDSHGASAFCAKAGLLRSRRVLRLLREPRVRQHRVIEELIGVARYFGPIKNEANESGDSREEVNERDEPEKMQHRHGESEVFGGLGFDGKIARAELAFQGFRDARIQNELPDYVKQGYQQEPGRFRRGRAVLRGATRNRTLQGEDVRDAKADDDEEVQEEKGQEMWQQVWPIKHNESFLSSGVPPQRQQLPRILSRQ